MSIQKSLELQAHSKQRIPGWTQLLSKRPDQFSDGVWPGYYKKAKGALVWDLDDNCYVDMSISGIGANVLGYADDDIDNAVIQSIKNGSSSSLNCYEEVELADALCNLHPWAEQVRFARTGGESMTIAVRIARASTGRSKIAFCGYHGWHDWYLSANLKTTEALNDHLISGLEPNGVPKELAGTAIPFRFNDKEALQKIVAEHGEDLAAIVMEPIRNQGPDPAFLAVLQEIREKTNVVIIVDEISAGFRIAPGGAHLTLNYVPDIAVFSKALGNGYPIGAVIGKEKIMSAAKNTFISSTCWTERVGFTAGIAVIEKYTRLNVHEHLVRIGTNIQAGWKDAAIKANIKIDVSGIAPLSHFSFSYPNALSLKAYFVQLMLDKGFLASNLFYSMYAHTDAHVSSYLKAVEDSFIKIKDAIDQNNLDACLRGKPANSGFLRLN
jgi:glutamate-1-semialdehyde 2,1-aminomutase